METEKIPNQNRKYLIKIISRYFKLFQHISNCFKVSQRIPTYFKLFLFISIYLYLFQDVPAYSQSDSLSEYLKIAAEKNPNLKAKYLKYNADLQQVPLVGTLPDPDVTFGYFIKPMELLGGQQRAQIQIMQMFPWFGTLKASKDEASAMALASFELFRQEKEEIFYNVKISYYQLFMNRKQGKVYDTTLVLLKSIEQLLLSKIKFEATGSSGNKNSQMPNTNSQAYSGMGMNGNKASQNQQSGSMSNPAMSGSSSSYADLLRLQIEIKELEDNFETLKNRYQLLVIQINTLLNRNARNEIYLPDSLSNPLIDYLNPVLFDSIKTNNPMIKMNQAEIAAYKKRQFMSRKMGYPMIGIGLNYNVIGKSEMNSSAMNGEDMVMPMLTVKLPIYRKKYKASVKEAENLENSSTEQLKNAENMLFMEYSAYRYNLIDANRTMTLYHNIIALTKQSLDLSLVQYTSAGTDFEAFIRLQKQLLDYRLTLVQLQVDKLSAIAGLQKLLSND